jgi:carboxyl-terminal processing protease
MTMSHGPRLLGMFAAAVLVLTGGASFGDERKALPPVEPAAHRFWEITDLILDNHVEPPARQEMLLAGLRAALKTAKVAPPADLARRVSRVATEAEFVALLQDLAPAVTRKDAPPLAELARAMSRGLLDAVPGHAELISADQVKAMEQIAHNRYVGTGIQVRMHAEEKFVQIITPFPGSPARRAGIKAGDLIEEVDGKSCTGLSLADVVRLLRGDEGVPVTVVVRQSGSSEKRTIKIVRDVVPFAWVFGYRRTGEESWQYRIDPAVPVAYVRVGGTPTSVVHELRQVEKQLQADGCKGLVLDLRNCVNGEAHQAALLADALLDGGVMWRVRDGRGRVKEYKADRDCLFRGWPVAVLINEHTRGSGADLVAAALQDAGRAVLVGEPTKPDGYVRGNVALPDGQGILRLRTGAVERVKPPKPPAGEETVAGSVQPDHRVALDAKKRGELFDWYTQQERAESAGKGGKPPEDAQLAKALEVVKAALR